MSKDDRDLGTYPKDPPDEWERVHRAVDRSERSWPITGPIVAAVGNWKAWGVMLAIFAFFRGPEVVGLIKTFLETLK